MAFDGRYLYTIIIEVLDTNGNVSDVYRLRYGLRTVEVSPALPQLSAPC